MLDIKFIRDHADKVQKAAKDKRFDVDIPHLLELDGQIKPLQQQLEALQEQRNQISKSIGKAPAEQREELKAKVGAIKTDMEATTQQLKPLREEFDDLMLRVPAPAREDVPLGKDDTENVELKTWGTPRTFEGFKSKDHMDLGESLDMIDVPRGVKLAGSRSYVLRGQGVLLERAILSLTFDHLAKKGFVPMTVPVLVREECMTGTGYFPTGRDQAYVCEKDELALVGTAEVSLTSYYSNEILSEAELPIRLMAQSSCFRREAGTYGKDTHGLYRVHQFQKIEQVIIGEADAAKSEQYHEELLTNAEEVMQALELPYRVVYVCTGDLGMGQVRKHDIETWMPSRQSYSETHSCSTFHDYQARRLKLRYKDSEQKTQPCYTLNNTAIATPRVLIPFLETFQQEDGSVTIPDALRPYLDGAEKISPSS